MHFSGCHVNNNLICVVDRQKKNLASHQHFHSAVVSIAIDAAHISNCSTQHTYHGATNTCPHPKFWSFIHVFQYPSPISINNLKLPCLIIHTNLVLSCLGTHSSPQFSTPILHQSREGSDHMVKHHSHFSMSSGTCQRIETWFYIRKPLEVVQQHRMNTLTHKEPILNVDSNSKEWFKCHSDDNIDETQHNRCPRTAHIWSAPLFLPFQSLNTKNCLVRIFLDDAIEN